MKLRSVLLTLYEFQELDHVRWPLTGFPNAWHLPLWDLIKYKRKMLNFFNSSIELFTELTCEKDRLRGSIKLIWNLDSKSETAVDLVDTWFFNSNRSKIRFLKCKFNPGVFSKTSEKVLLK